MKTFASSLFFFTVLFITSTAYSQPLQKESDDSAITSNYDNVHLATTQAPPSPSVSTNQPLSQTSPIWNDYSTISNSILWKISDQDPGRLETCNNGTSISGPQQKLDIFIFTPWSNTSFSTILLQPQPVRGHNR